MNSLRLKEAMEQVHMKEEMQEDIIRNIKRKTERRVLARERLHKAATAAAVFVLIAGAAAIPIQAGIRYLVKDRMENIPKQELEAVNQMVQDQDHTEADRFSRAYSAEERRRMHKLQ